jgi:hypothetical protein
MEHIDSDGGDWEREIAALEAESRREFLARNFQRLGELMSDRGLVNSPIHVVHDQARVLALLGAGVIAHESLEGEIEAMRRYGDVVVVMGNETVRDAAGPTRRRRFTNVWSKEQGHWRLIARHAHVIPEAGAKP